MQSEKQGRVVIYMYSTIEQQISYLHDRRTNGISDVIHELIRSLIEAA